ncbi:DUF1289 domain-containing protein [Leucothrix mucor]|uniref:DUF1289 domain-containing protein n=1 Tax=Leucothrix mucor TaxID=45248 RepID=UPI0003B6D8DC|nr:DUF1289 domain-containing protein [Leucothrix mucor]
MTDSARSTRRRRTNRSEIDYSVPSPCVKLCGLNNETGRCDGCFRTMDEIREWMIMSREQKLDVLEQVEVRKAE